MESSKLTGDPFSPIQEYIDVSTTILRELPKKRSSVALANELVDSTNQTIEECVAERVSKRATKKKEIQLKAEGHKRAGDVLLESKNYKAAYPQYLEAIQLQGNVPDHYISLAAAYRKLAWHEEAAHAATRALTIDPKNLEARYVRGVARLEQRLLKAAQTDFEILLEHDSTHLRALAAIAEVKQFISQAGAEDLATTEAENEIDFTFPQWDYEALEVASVSDSSDCYHVGNGVPCWFYNRTGCTRGAECMYSHAPDEKSVRDDLGRNVCIYYILDNCKFGPTKCVYSHSKDALPKRGWWNRPDKVAKVKEVLKVAEKNVREQRQRDAIRWRTHLKELKDVAKRTGLKGRRASHKKGEVKLREVQDGRAGGESKVETRKIKDGPVQAGVKAGLRKTGQNQIKAERVRKTTHGEQKTSENRATSTVDPQKREY